MKFIKDVAFRLSRAFSLWVWAAALAGALCFASACEDATGAANQWNNEDSDEGGETDNPNSSDESSSSDPDDSESENVDLEELCTGENPPMDLCKMVSAPACGDGELNQDDEVCDDGNTLPGDGCTGICKVEPNWECPDVGKPCVYKIECGNGVLEAGEVCDDGNLAADDGCNAECEQSANYSCPIPGEDCIRIVFCGDGRINGDENCEDGNTEPGDGCDENCVKESGWVCAVPGEACTPGPRCGDGILSLGINEACDDGNTTAGDGCDDECQIESGWVCPSPGSPCQNTTVCGDGRVTGNEECDDANTDPDDGCDDCDLQPGYECPFPGAKCLADCGDGFLMENLGEECDDGNEDENDGCTATCEWEDGFVCSGTPPNYTCRETVCGDQVVEGTEACDDGNNNMGDGCTPFCDKEPDCNAGACTSTCGDGLLLTSVGEECDDGNARNGDGCTADCLVEDGFQCVQPPIGDTMTVPIVYRDFDYDHPDFENGVSGQTEGNPGMVEDMLDADGKPVYTGAVNNAHVASTSSFEQWFRDSSVSDTVVDELVLYDNGSGGFVNRWGDDGEPFVYYSDAVWCGQGGGTGCDLYPGCVEGAVDADGNDISALYETYGVCQDPCVYWGPENTSACMVIGLPMEGNPLFYPLDDIDSPDVGVAAKVPPPYADSWPYEGDEDGPLHNFSFTSEVRYWFQYNSDQTYTLDFLGDDDVWVFLNNQLAVDLGGIHTPVAGNLTLETPADGAAFDLVNGQVYEIVVFQAERQTDCSSYQLTLGGFNAEETKCGPICGDAVMSPGEQCDNGEDENTGEYGKCGTDCTRGPYCGDAIVQEEYEECDDGLNVSAYGTASTGCSPGCVRPASCGDGIVQPEFGELCDNVVNDGSYGGCSPNCLGAPWCGDGVVNESINPETGEPYEVCDDGLNDGTYGTCAEDCLLGPRCGDGIVQEEWGEDCDGGDECSSTCRFLGYCGDALINFEINPDTGLPFEQCDDGINDGGYGECAPECKLGPYCGDGAVEPLYEICDDSINDGGYGECAPGCVLGPHCGDGEVQPAYEECDFGEDQNGTQGVLCTTACKTIHIVAE
ncbi:MAG: DUF4215 domain-containing protein [Deltaproteobacteria bacterium]|nr:DUF4215 domain-containing protein [Deltaproteobacteria bacterium]